MTQEEKQLILIDLCARLPYGVKMLHSEEFPKWFSEIYGKGTSVFIFTLSPDILAYTITELDRVKPYLRPMSSMTEEEKSEQLDIKKGECDGCVLTGKGDPNTEFMLIDFYNKHHLDYRGLIPMGLALKAKEGIYKTE